ncbi:MAG: toll/interleukin-1 receptor domain-containing protein [Phycisphaerae bacterium]|nr:toll/interleukin-1 receptor domain-containing protein [Phycisphaerae bacterium]
MEVLLDGEVVGFGSSTNGCTVDVKVRQLDSFRKEELREVPHLVDTFLLQRSHRGFVVKCALRRRRSEWEGTATILVKLNAWRWSWSANDLIKEAPGLCSALFSEMECWVRPRGYILRNPSVAVGESVASALLSLYDSHRKLVAEVDRKCRAMAAEDERLQHDGGRPRRGETIFICHASEDKASIARPLADELRNRGYQVWLDDFVLRLGDSLRREIERGLALCSYGIVILSPKFFEKEWPQRELDGLTAREIDERRKLILPIWHLVDLAFISKVAPNLADKLAISTEAGIDELAKEIDRAITDLGKD